ncbi:hypothetical protein [Actinomadura kijaniata]|uniref:hypothetical protein n=1 Tax=Actinomadura kijaniata TaxID=46161 RepID=UPI0012F81C76|nr:hypothetical protein [Actinomadura kijaniata]
MARRMQRFFKTLTHEQRADPRTVAIAYGQHLWSQWRTGIADEKRLSRSRFYVGLALENSSIGEVTKRSALVADTLLLSHGCSGIYTELGRISDGNFRGDMANAACAYAGGMAMPPYPGQEGPVDEFYGMHCPDLDLLGRWVLDCEPLLRAGLAWYLPGYSSRKTASSESGATPDENPQAIRSIDLLIRDGRAVDASGVHPVKSKIVRPVLEIDLPFLENVDLKNFSRITVEEFQSYVGFRDFLRMSFLGMDDALNAVQSERELVRIGLDIADQVRATRAEMAKVNRKRAVAVTGAAVGSATAVLTAVYGPALAAVVTAVGAAGGWLPALQAMAENSKLSIREDKWYYVWMLSKESTSP